MWKLIVIHPLRLSITEDNEKICRETMELVPYSRTALFAFLYDDKQRLVETFIHQYNKGAT